MIRIDRGQRRLHGLERRAIPDAGLTERGDLQQMIRSSPDIFFAEIDEKLLLIGEEVCPTDCVDDRIDLLAIDEEGAVVVIELKRSNHKLHLLQALAYASYVSKFDAQKLVDMRARFTGMLIENAEEEIEQFIVHEFPGLNQVQRVVLIAEAFDYSVLATAEWLTEKYGVDIRCYRLTLAVDGQNEFLTCACVYPPPELATVARQRGKARASGGPRPVKWSNWDEALADIPNQAIVEFFRAELAAGRPNYVGKRAIRIWHHGRRRWIVSARRKSAYVWQIGRFPDDESIWKRVLGDGAEVKPVQAGRRLRFSLSSEEQFRRFRGALDGQVASVQFLPRDETDSDEEEADE